VSNRCSNPWKKFGRVVSYMRAALGPSSEQLTRWDHQERKPFEKKVPKKEEGAEPVVESPPTSPVRGRSRKRSDSAGPAKAAVEPPPAASRSRSVGAGKKPARGKKPAQQTPEQAAEAAAAVARAAKLAAYRDPASAAARAAADAAADRVRDAVLATQKACGCTDLGKRASREAAEEAVLRPTRANLQAARTAEEQIKQLEAEVAAAQQEEAEAVAASTVEDVPPEPVEPPAHQLSHQLSQQPQQWLIWQVRRPRQGVAHVRHQWSLQRGQLHCPCQKHSYPHPWV
jgi:hypothetical protein